MNGPELLTCIRDQLACAVAERGNPPPAALLDISPWVAMSLLQKAIRRGHEELALTAAATLLCGDPNRLWRRLGCIAFEDIGVANLGTVYLTVAALAGKRFRTQLGGEWAVASYIVSNMVQAPKCRAADDLLMSAELHPTYKQARVDLAQATTPDLLNIATSPGPLSCRALALWYAIGTGHRPSRHLLPKRGAPHAVFDYLCDAGYPHTVVEIAREGFRKVGEVLCPFVALLCPERQGETVALTDDQLPIENEVRGIPGWAFDLYSREGRLAFNAFLQRDSETARWVRAHIPPAQRVNFLGGIVFRVEGGGVRSLLRWRQADVLRRLVDVECQGAHCPDASEILDLMRADMPLLNEVRAHVL
jgi:hypothetical protein